MSERVPFLRQMLRATNQKPWELAHAIGVKHKDIQPLLDVAEPVGDGSNLHLWNRIHEYLNERLGLMLAARFELDRALQKERQKRAVLRATTQRLSKQKGKGRVRLS